MKASLGLLIFILPIFAAAEVVVPIDKVANSVNIRISADSATEIVGKLKQGESLPLIKSVPGWHEVEIAGGAAGFISSDWNSFNIEPSWPGMPVRSLREMPIRVMASSERVSARSFASS